METKTHWKKAFKSDYLSAADIDDKDVILTIEKVVYKECITASGKKFCNVAIFKEKDIKPMILNVTNSKLIKKFAGNHQHLEDWNNIPVRIYVDAKVKFGSDIVEGLRIRDTQPSAAKPKLTKDMPAWKNALQALKDGKSITVIEDRYDIADVKKELLFEAEQ